MLPMNPDISDKEIVYCNTCTACGKCACMKRPESATMCMVWYTKGRCRSCYAGDRCELDPSRITHARVDWDAAWRLWCNVQAVSVSAVDPQSAQIFRMLKTDVEEIAKQFGWVKERS